MDWIAIVQIVGSCVAFGGATFYVRGLLRRARTVSGKAHVRTTQPVESADELWGQAVLWGGLVVGLGGGVARDIEKLTSPYWLAVSIVGAAGAVLGLGMHLGRLSERRQLRLEAAALEESRDARPNA